MSDLETQIENISYVLSELRDENNHKVITHCLQELQGVKKKVSQRELSITFEKQENQLLREYENKYLHAQKVIAELERELDDLKCQEHQAESPDDILMERTNFWKDKENYSHYTPEGKISSFKAMENFVADLEYKTLNKEKENEIDKTQIKQLEEQNAEYQQQVLYYSRELEELTKNVEEYQIRMSLAKDKSDTSHESSQRKAELDFLRGKVEDLEKEIQSKNSTISSLESKLKTTEEKTQVLATSLNEIMEENETLKTEKEEIKEAYKAAYDELKEKVIFKRDRSGERKCLVTYNNLPIKASVSDSREFSDSKSATHSEHHTPHDETLLRTKLEFPSNTKMSNFCPSSICNHEEKSLHEIEDEVVIHSSEEKPSQLHEEKTTAGAAKDSFSHYHDRQGFDNRSKAKSSQIEEDDSLDKLPNRKPYSLPKKKPQTFDEHLAGGHLGCCQTCNIF